MPPAINDEEISKKITELTQKRTGVVLRSNTPIRTRPKFEVDQLIPLLVTTVYTLTQVKPAPKLMRRYPRARIRPTSLRARNTARKDAAIKPKDMQNPIV